METLIEILKLIGKIAIVLFIVLLFVAAVIGSIERNKWLSAHCKKIGQVSGRTAIVNTFSGGKMGIGTAYVPGNTGYSCDDGMTYWE